MTIIDHDGVSNIDFRKKFMEAELIKIRNTVNGRGESYLPFITEENGKITDAKTDQFINDLIEALLHHRKARSYSPSLNSETEEFYRCFLYCTILGIAQNDDFSFDTILLGSFEPAQTFADIVNMAKDPCTTAYHTRESLISDESGLFYDWYELNGGFFGYGDTVYNMITGKKITCTYSEEEKARLAARDAAREIEMTREMEEEELKDAKKAGFETVQEYSNWLDSLKMEEEYDFEPDPDFMQLQEEMVQQAARKEKALIQNMPDPDRYIREYLRYRDLYFKVNNKYSLPLDIENMVDTYLYERGLSAFCLGDAFGLVSHKMKLMPNMLKTEIRKARRMF